MSRERQPKSSEEPRLCELDRRIRAYYQRSADYHENIGALAGGRPNDEEKDLFDALNKALTGSVKPRVLEVGCGRAESVGWLLQKIGGGAYVGLDPSVLAVGAARRTNATYGAVAGDGTALPFADRVFDACFFNYVLEHSVRPAEFLREAIRVTKVGGLIAMIVPVADLPWVLPSSLRHRRSDLGFVASTAIARWFEALMIRYVPSYFAFQLVTDPVVLIEGAGPFQADDDQVYWARSFEIRKFLERTGCEIEWSGAREIRSYISNGRRPAVDALRRAAFAALRMSLGGMSESQFTTTVSIVARKVA